LGRGRRNSKPALHQWASQSRVLAERASSAAARRSGAGDDVTDIDVEPEPPASCSRTRFRFTTGNDPYREHDFGFFELVGRTFYWKIDYYDQRCEFGSKDPADPEKTTRVLALMLAAEY
jgi:hypothetical protein